MDISVLRSFVTIYEEKKISAAADKLFMSKQALSSIIHKMETELDTTLFVRTRSGVQPTAEGRLFYERARQILDMWDSTEQGLADLKRMQRANLRVGFGYICWNLWSKDIEDRFTHKHPHIDLHTLTMPSRQLIHELDDRNIDLMITGIKPDFSLKYACQTLRTYHPGFLIPHEDPLSAHEIVTLSDLNGRKLIFLDTGLENREALIQFLRERNVRVNPIPILFSNLLSMLRLTREENAMLLTSNLHGFIALDIGNFCYRPLEQTSGAQALATRIYAVTIGKGAQNPNVELFLRFFLEELPPEC